MHYITFGCLRTQSFFLINLLRSNDNVIFVATLMKQTPKKSAKNKRGEDYSHRPSGSTLLIPIVILRGSRALRGRQPMPAAHEKMPDSTLVNRTELRRPSVTLGIHKRVAFPISGSASASKFIDVSSSRERVATFR